MEENHLFSLMSRRFGIYMMVLLLVSAPVFYFIVVGYYAEDLNRVAAMAHVPPSQLDLERDSLMGLFLQISMFVVLLLACSFVVMRVLPKKLWQPFYDTLNQIQTFKVESGVVPQLGVTKVAEFNQLNETLTQIMQKSCNSYKAQKEFTENASHELQTPLAVMQCKLDLLIQDEHLTEQQATIVQDVYRQLRQVSRLDRSLLLLAKLDNNQFRMLDKVSLSNMLDEIRPSLEAISGDIRITIKVVSDVTLACNEALLKSMIDNLVVNGVRHNKSGGNINIIVMADRLLVENTSTEPPLDATHIFDRFYRADRAGNGNGLGLSIVKSICEYHGWRIWYDYVENQHRFSVIFGHTPERAQ